MKCPKCSSEDIRKGTMAAFAKEVYMYPEGNLRSKPSPMSSEYCRGCGYVLGLYVAHPEMLD